MKTLILAGLLALGLTGSAFAQDDPPESISVNIGNGTYTLEIKKDEAIVFYAATTITNIDGQFIEPVIIAQTADGVTRLTPCDDIKIACEGMTFRMEDINQGDSLVLRKYDDGTK